MIIDFQLPPEKPNTRPIPLPRSSYCFGTFAFTFTIICLLLFAFSFMYITLPQWLTSSSFVSLYGDIDEPAERPWFTQNPAGEATALKWYPPLLLQDNSFRLEDIWIGKFFGRENEKPRWVYDRLARRLPQCIIIGARKSGTRALIEFLDLHPRIKKASDEMHFFDEEQNYPKGLEWYRRKMPYSYADQITVEKSPAYFITRYVPQRIKTMNSSIALILVVKDPVKRVLSDYTQTLINRIRKGKKYLSFEQTVLNGDGSVDSSYKPIRVSLYHRHLSNWLEVFPKEQILIVDGDTLIGNPVEELAKVERFLGLSHQINQERFHFNETKGFFCIRDSIRPDMDRCLSKTKGRPHPAVSLEVVEKLTNFFRPHNEIFYKMVGRDFGW